MPALRPTVILACLRPGALFRGGLRPAALLAGGLLLGGCMPAYDAGLIHQLDREIIAAKQRTAMLEAQVAACSTGDLESEIYTQLAQVFAGTEVEVQREGPRAVVIIPGGLLFRPGETSVREEAAMVLDLLATALELHADSEAWIIGHTDDESLSGSLARRHGDNWGLSTARARAFMERLVADFRLDAARFTVAGKGPSEPMASNDTPEGRARNRRIVVVVGPAEQYR